MWRIILLLTLNRQSFLLFWALARCLGAGQCRFNENLWCNICTTMMLICAHIFESSTDSARDNISVNTRKVKRESMALATHFGDCTSIIASACLESSKHKKCLSSRRIFSMQSKEFNRRAIGIWCEYRWELTTEPRQSGIEIDANNRASVSLRDIIYEWYKAHWITTLPLRRFLFNRPPSVPSVKTVRSVEKK